MNYAYARVSTADQNLNRQIDSFLALGVSKGYIYSDKKSGKNFERENYKRLIKRLKSGDLLIIKSIDRLGRDYEKIIEEWHYITKDIGADILVLDTPLLDTRVNDGNLTGKLISDIVLQLLSYVAQQEREFIKARQFEGIASAKRRGIVFGRPAVPVPTDFPDIVFAYKRKKITFIQALARAKMKKTTFYVRMREVLDRASDRTPPVSPACPSACAPCDAAAAIPIHQPVASAPDTVCANPHSADRAGSAGLSSTSAMLANSAYGNIILPHPIYTCPSAPLFPMSNPPPYLRSCVQAFE